MKFSEFAILLARFAVYIPWLPLYDFPKELLMWARPEWTYNINKKISEKYDISASKLLAREIYATIDNKLKSDAELKKSFYDARDTKDTVIRGKAIKDMYAVLAEHYKIKPIILVKFVEKYDSMLGGINEFGMLLHFDLIDKKSFNLKTLIHEFTHALQLPGKSSQEQSLVRKANRWYSGGFSFGTKKQKKFSSAIYDISILEREANDVSTEVMRLHHKRPMGMD